MPTAIDPGDPVRIDVSLPEALPGVCVARFRSDERLYRSAVGEGSLRHRLE